MVSVGTSGMRHDTGKKCIGNNLYSYSNTTCFIYDRRLEDLMLMKCA